MIFDHQLLLKQEEKSLAPYAVKSSQTKGRKYAEEEDHYRTPFQRDRDRIIHSKAFRRLSGKTQVFIASYGDHYRSRLTHSLEVAQVGRDIARALGLNEDLVEAIALAHDLGHTPFGHAGQDAMNEMMMKFGHSFEHNEQSLRIVTLLERKSPYYPGLNLSYEILEGLMKHKKYHDDGILIHHSLEAQVVNIADAIAYHHHDLDDGLRAKILSFHELSSSVQLWAIAVEDLSVLEWGGKMVQKQAIRRLMSMLIEDLIFQSHQNITKQKFVISFSHRMQNRVDQLSEFLGNTFYLHEKVSKQSHKGKRVIYYLFDVFSKNENLLPITFKRQLETEKRYILIKDYISGMTDHFALKLYKNFST